MCRVNDDLLHRVDTPELGGVVNGPGIGGDITGLEGGIISATTEVHEGDSGLGLPSANAAERRPSVNTRCPHPQAVLSGAPPSAVEDALREPWMPRPQPRVVGPMTSGSRFRRSPARRRFLLAAGRRVQYDGFISVDDQRPATTLPAGSTWRRAYDAATPQTAATCLGIRICPFSDVGRRLSPTLPGRGRAACRWRPAIESR